MIRNTLSLFTNRDKLKLLDYEIGYLKACLHHLALPDYMKEAETDLWYGYQVGDRMFDLSIYGGKGCDDFEHICCVVYECYWEDDNWHTDCVNGSYLLWSEAQDDA